MAACWDGVVTECVVGILALLYPVGLGPVGCQLNLPGRYWRKCGVRACLGGYPTATVVGPVPYRVQLWPDPAKTSSAIN